MERVDFSTLEGKTLTSIVAGKGLDHEDQIDFSCTDGSQYRMVHIQDCCENVWLEFIDPHYTGLIGQEILVAEERESKFSSTNEFGITENGTLVSYVIRTNAASVDIEWRGTSNGYYSERAELYEVSEDSDDEYCEDDD